MVIQEVCLLRTKCSNYEQLDPIGVTGGMETVAVNVDFPC